jgi:hypothetical protein
VLNFNLQFPIVYNQVAFAVILIKRGIQKKGIKLWIPAPAGKTRTMIKKDKSVSSPPGKGYKGGFFDYFRELFLCCFFFINMVIR